MPGMETELEEHDKASLPPLWRGGFPDPLTCLRHQLAAKAPRDGVAVAAQKTIASYDKVPGGGADFGADTLILVATGNREHVRSFRLADCP
ncbi:hypothetical protein [Cupriavidus basilensis]|uniref:hypothetical protein n=1 Tax=Cupriavidus basilensis TaxID=68895 RepID=UPI001146D0D7|nr:hypothetical protein [Cupriavidus basilensis]